ncbi:unnamed protein product [Allacma fusca]|uniref:Uncharacterized protein n=1 Tax=Allacma fusca TaxID=39272 RepID=A0A8J2NXD7_9HEXA|nr:unnamed protein product [Allacma fusca]
MLRFTCTCVFIHSNVYINDGNGSIAKNQIGLANSAVQVEVPANPKLRDFAKSLCIYWEFTTVNQKI